MLPLLDIIVSSPPLEPSASWSSSWRLLVALPVGFLILLGVFWAGVALAKCLKRHSGQLKSNLSASPNVSAEHSDETKTPPKES